MARQSEEDGDDAHQDDGDGAQDRAAKARGDDAGEEGQDEAAHPRHEGGAGVDRHGRRQREEVLPGTEGTQDHDLQCLAGGQDSEERLGAQRCGASQQEVGGKNAKRTRHRVPTPARRSGGQGQAAGDACTGSDGAHSPTEHGLEGPNGSCEKQRENQEGPDRQPGAVGRKALRNRQQTVARGLELRTLGGG